MDQRTRNSIRIVLLFALLLVPIFYALFTATDLSYSWAKKIIYSAVVAVCLLFPALLLKARTYFIVEGIFNFLFIPIEIASLYLNRQPTSAPFLQNILHTNRMEAKELLSFMWPVCLLVIAAWIGYFILAAKVENRYLFGPLIRKIVLCGTLLLFVGGTSTMMVLLKRLHSERSIGETMAEAVGLVEMKFYKIYPYNLYIHSCHLLQKKHRIRQLKEQVDSFRFGIQPMPDSKELVILVIGEAARYDHFGLNGYGRNTTPGLSATANLISYERVYTQANQTDYAVPILLTRASADRFELAYSEKSLLEAFQEAGVWSAYISKQIPSEITERIGTSCDYSHFYSKNIDIDGNYDDQMIQDLQSHVLDTMQFFVLHSLGSHFRYEHRYPASFEHFLPILGRSASYAMISEENKDKLVNAYDNSILYTDFFLSELIRYVASLNRPAAVVYISDHGESF